MMWLRYVVHAIASSGALEAPWPVSYRAAAVTPRRIAPRRRIATSVRSGCRRARCTQARQGAAPEHEGVGGDDEEGDNEQPRRPLCRACGLFVYQRGDRGACEDDEQGGVGRCHQVQAVT